MYSCCSLKKFLRLLFLDAVVFVVCFMCFIVGKTIVFSADTKDEDIFLPVVMYHSINEGEPHDYSVTPKQVEGDLMFFRENGYTSVTASQLIEYVYGNGELPNKPVLITLDDGFYNNLYYLTPLLEKYNMNAIVSIVGSYTDNNADKDPHVPEYSYLTWSDVNELIASGRIEIGNHTYDMHSYQNYRKGCCISEGEDLEHYYDVFNKDISYLQSEIYENIGILPTVFAYPYGAVCKESIPILKENGFMITLTCREKPNYLSRKSECLYGLGRYNRSGKYSTEEYMSNLLEGEKSPETES